MNSLLKPALKLAIICFAAALALGLVNAKASPIIEARKAANLKEKLGALIEGEAIADGQLQAGQAKHYYRMQNASEGNFIVLELGPSGYGGPMTLLAAYRPDGSLINAVLAENSETPGIGKLAENASYMEMFKNKGAAEPLPATAAETASPDAVSGATVTFLAVSGALIEGSNLVKEGKIP